MNNEGTVRTGNHDRKLSVGQVVPEADRRVRPTPLLVTKEQSVPGFPADPENDESSENGSHVASLNQNIVNNNNNADMTSIRSMSLRGSPIKASELSRYSMISPLRSLKRQYSQPAIIDLS